MRILFVWSAAEFSIFDVAHGYRNALHDLGHHVRDYHLYNRMRYHAAALGTAKEGAGKELAEDAGLVSRCATENVVVEALYHEAELVVVASGLSFHPNGLWLLRRAGIPVATIMTESPYDDEKQLEFAAVYPEMAVFTHDAYSAREYGWDLLEPAYDPTIHTPTPPDGECDVLFVGTGWEERQRLLEAVDWTGIDLHLEGFWLGIEPDSLLFPFYRGGCVDNKDLPAKYAGAKICLNMHRSSPNAESMNPRAYELAACGAFQLSDHRARLVELFGGSVPTFEGSRDLEDKIRYYLSHSEDRIEKAELARSRVQGETFEARAKHLINEIGRRLGGDPLCNRRRKEHGHEAARA